MDEFDMPNPHQKLKGAMDAISREIDAGRGDEMVRDMRLNGSNELADIVQNMIKIKEDGHMTRVLDSNRTVDSGDAAKALRDIDERHADGALADGEALKLKLSVYQTADDPAGELETIVRLDEMYGKTSYSNRAHALYRLGRIKEMEELCETWEGSRQDRDDLYLCRARILRARGKPDLARMHAVAMLILEKYDMYAIELLGDILADAGDLRGAVLHYNKALDYDYNEMQFHVKKAEALMRMGRPDSAALACRRGLEVRPADERLLAMLDEVG